MPGPRTFPFNKSYANRLPKPCTPCMLYHAQTAATSTPSLRALTAQAQHKKFVDTYRLLPQSEEELAHLVANQGEGKVFVRTPIQKGELQSFAFNYVGRVNGILARQDNVYTDIFRDMGVLKIFLPGEYTPTCDGTHLPSYLHPDILRAYKQAGIDVLVFVTPGKQDSLNRWLRDALQPKGLAHLVPDVLPTNDPDARLTLHRSMPMIVGQACPGLEDINAHGLVFTSSSLGMVSHRACAVYDIHGTLRLLVKASDPSLQMCAPVLANAMLKEVQNLKLSHPYPVRPKL